MREDHLHNIVINENGINSLIIHRTHKWDSGTYTCVATNRAGEDRLTVGLNVIREYLLSAMLRKLYLEPTGDLRWCMSLSSASTLAQFYTKPLFIDVGIDLGVGQCEHTMIPSACSKSCLFVGVFC